MAGATYQQMADRVSQLMDERLGTRGRDLQARVGRAGRRLPRRVREAALMLAEAAHLAQNPRLSMQLDPGRLAAAYDLCLAHLNAVNPAERRKTLALQILASIAFALLVVAGLVLAVLRLRGYLG